MAEMIIILKLDVDLKNIADITGDSYDHIQAKLRAHVATIVREKLVNEKYVRIESSAIAEETDICDTTSKHKMLRIVETCLVAISGNPEVGEKMKDKPSVNIHKMGTKNKPVTEQDKAKIKAIIHKCETMSIRQALRNAMKNST